MPAKRLGSSAIWWFLGIAFGWTWSLGFSAAGLGGPVGRILHLLALLGPLLAWLSVLLAESNRATTRAFLSRVFDVRSVSPAWWAAVGVVGVGLPGVAAAITAIAGGEAGLDPGATASSVVGAVGFALAAGLAEEPGWRGIAQSAAEPDAGRWGAATLLGVLWSVWHLPLYFIAGTYQHGLGVGTLEFWESMVIRVPLAVLLVWLVYSTRGAIVAAVAAHALGNVTGELLVVGPSASILELLLTAFAAAWVVTSCLRHGRANTDEDTVVDRL